MNLHSRALVLKRHPFNESDHILTLFTQERGVIKMFVKGYSIRSIALHSLFAPLTEGEYFYKKGKGDLFQFSEGAILDQNLALRTSWEAIEMAEKMSQALLISQDLEKPASALYTLFSFFLKKLPSFHEGVVLAAFLLKILKYEGIFQFQPHCLQCGKPLTERYRFGGKSYCKTHALEGSEEISLEEESLLLSLIQATSFKEVQVEFSKELLTKVEKLFQQANLI